MKLSTGPVLAVVSLMFFAGCTDCNETTTAATTPTSSTPTATQPTTPAPAPTPAPTTARTCTLPSMPDCGGTGCCKEGGIAQFDGEIDAAQQELRRTNPALFNSNGSIAVTEIEYTGELAKKITEMFGLCTRGGGVGSVSKDEVAVKRDNSLSQNTDVILGAGNLPHVGGRYTCTPASF